MITYLIGILHEYGGNRDPSNKKATFLYRLECYKRLSPLLSCWKGSSIWCCALRELGWSVNGSNWSSYSRN